MPAGVPKIAKGNKIQVNDGASQAFVDLADVEGVTLAETSRGSVEWIPLDGDDDVVHVPDHTRQPGQTTITQLYTADNYQRALDLEAKGEWANSPTNTVKLKLKVALKTGDSVSQDAFVLNVGKPLSSGRRDLMTFTTTWQMSGPQTFTEAV